MNRRIKHIDGWMALQELNWLYHAASQVPDGGLIVEIGVWKGRSSGALCEGAGKNKAVVSVDTWGGQPDLVGSSHSDAVTTDLFQVYRRNMADLGVYPFPYRPGQLGAQYLTGGSVEVAQLFADGSVDLLFIDGDHLNCAADIDAWLPKVKTPGIISGHDYFCFFETIQQEIHKRFYIHNVCYSIWIRFHNGVKPDWY